MKSLIRNARIVTDGCILEGDVLIDGERIARIGGALGSEGVNREIDAHGRLLLPGMIDDQVHFREPGMTHKGNLITESAAAVAGGITSFMDLPNTVPHVTDRATLADKYDRARGRARANYAFYLGADNDNIEEIEALAPDEACGVMAFMGPSTSGLVIDDPAALEALFSHYGGVIASHCEHGPTIRQHEAHFLQRYGEDIPFDAHPLIRSAQACYKATEQAVALARAHGSRLHVLHLSTARELELFTPGPVEGKQITAEVCLHHLWFSDQDYDAQGARIKCNPAIKTAADRSALRTALADGRIDLVATGHAPHTLEEKIQPYRKAASGLPLAQHALLLLLELVREGVLDLPTAVARASHAPAARFGIVDRGHIREGAYADLVLVNPDHHTDVSADTLVYKCGWSPVEGTSFSHHIDATFVNGIPVWDGRDVAERAVGQRLQFHRA